MNCLSSGLPPVADHAGVGVINLRAVSTTSDHRCEVAVIVPCYNAASYLARALDSVLAQTYSNFRLCVVDDGSTDETAKILRRYAEYGPCVRQRHSGAAVARNRGIAVTKGRYIAFLDADDYWMPTKLERQIALLEQKPRVGLACSDCETIEGQRYTGSYFSNRNVPKTGKLFEALMRECFVFTPTVVVRRACVEEIGMFDESLQVSEDFDLWLRIASRWDVAVIPEVLAVREKRSDGLSLSTHPDRSLQDGIAALENVKSACSRLSLSESRTLQKAVAERYYVYGSYLLANGDRTKSRKKLVKVLQHWPVHGRAWIKYALTFLSANSFRRLMQSHRRFARSRN